MINLRETAVFQVLAQIAGEYNNAVQHAQHSSNPLMKFYSAERPVRRVEEVFQRTYPWSLMKVFRAAAPDTWTPRISSPSRASLPATLTVASSACTLMFQRRMLTLTDTSKSPLEAWVFSTRCSERWSECGRDSSKPTLGISYHLIIQGPRDRSC